MASDVLVTTIMSIMDNSQSHYMKFILPQFSSTTNTSLKLLFFL